MDINNLIKDENLILVKGYIRQKRKPKIVEPIVYDEETEQETEPVYDKSKVELIYDEPSLFERFINWLK